MLMRNYLRDNFHYLEITSNPVEPIVNFDEMNRYAGEFGDGFKYSTV